MFYLLVNDGVLLQTAAMKYHTKSMKNLGTRIARARHRTMERLYGHYDCKTVIIALHREQALYFAVPKVASSSIEYAITDILKARLPKKVVSEIYDGTHFFRGKAKRREMRDRKHLLCKHEVPRFKHYYSFAFVRNPWSRLVSCFFDKVDPKDITEDLNPKGAASVLLGTGGTAPDQSATKASFEDFVRAVCRTPDEASNRHYRSQHTFLTDRKGRLMPEHIFRFENLAEEFNAVVERLGLPEAKLPHKNPSKKTSYQEYYTDELRRLTAERYRRDIELFGYEFES